MDIVSAKAPFVSSTKTPFQIKSNKSKTPVTSFAAVAPNLKSKQLAKKKGLRDITNQTPLAPKSFNSAAKQSAKVTKKAEKADSALSFDISKVAANGETEDNIELEYAPPSTAHLNDFQTPALPTPKHVTFKSEAEEIKLDWDKIIPSIDFVSSETDRLDFDKIAINEIEMNEEDDDVEMAFDI